MLMLLVCMEFGDGEGFYVGDGCEEEGIEK